VLPIYFSYLVGLLILLDPVEDVPQAACQWVMGARNGSFLGPMDPGSRENYFFTYRDYCPPERTGKYPSQGTTPLGSSWNLGSRFLNLT
jgi:hypothetical protein